MSPYEFKKLLETVKYKPGTKISVAANDAAETMTIHIRMKVDNAYKNFVSNLLTTTVVHLKRVITYTQIEFMPDEHVKFYVRGLFWELENHEMDEFLTIDGQRPFNPHKNDEVV